MPLMLTPDMKFHSPVVCLLRDQHHPLTISERQKEGCLGDVLVIQGPWITSRMSPRTLALKAERCCVPCRESEVRG